MTTQGSEKVFGDRALEVFAALLLGLATIGSAWCAFQAARWNNNETREARQATDARIESSRLFALGTQKVAYDATIAAQYATAFVDGRTDLQRFYREALVRPDFLPILDEWEAKAKTGEPVTGSLFEDEAYLDAQFADSRKYEADADAATIRSEEASRNADGFVQTTIIMATALFLAGVTSTFRSRFVRIMIIAAAAIVLAGGAAHIIDLPFA